MEKIAVRAQSISKIYTLKDAVHKYRKGLKFYALKDVSFEVEQGDVVGILGTNGSGKSTLSLILSGISDISGGTLYVNGEPSLIAVNTGLNDQLTGIDNIRFKGALLGMRKKEVDAVIEQVKAFSELGEYLYQPVKKYSSGMKSRLGFSVCLALKPDILIVDEALSVGDRAFSAKCLSRMGELIQSDRVTVFFVSHSLAEIRKFCKKAMWIESGTLKEFGECQRVCDHYAAYTDKLAAMDQSRQSEFLQQRFQERILSK